MPYFNIFGHVHNNPEYRDRPENTWCVSLERTDYFPVELNLENIQKVDIERDYESEFFHRMYADLVISEDEAKAIRHKYLTLDEIFNNAHKIKTRLSKAYQAESNKQYIEKLIQQQNSLKNDEKYLQAQLDRIRTEKYLQEQLDILRDKKE
jgi:hypothetical protein